MKTEVVIRSDADVGSIAEVTVSAFKALEISNYTEQFVVAALRAAGALSISPDSRRMANVGLEAALS